MKLILRRILPMLITQAFILLVVYIAIERFDIPLLSGLLIGATSETVLIWIMIWRRQNKIKQLNRYLSDINAGKAKINFTDFTEGELTILQSELFRLSETLHSQNEQLKQDKKFILDSLNDITHQLKTPLTSIVMMVDFLQQEDLPQEKKEAFLENIEKQLDRLQGLITNLLTLSKLEANVINYNPQPILDNEFIDRLLSSFDVQIDFKDIKLEVSADNQLVNIDIDWTIEALSNIVKNALEHMPNGGSLKIISSVNLMYWQILIEDNGTGIKEEDLGHVFERFYRGKTSRKDSVGIGLSLTKRIINQQKGLIKVESEVDKYTRFIIRFLK